MSGVAEDWEEQIVTEATENANAAETTTAADAASAGHRKSISSEESKTLSSVDTATNQPTFKVKKGLAAPDPRPHLNVVFIGHVDAGKSTTCGNILFLTGQVDSRTIEKYERDAKEKGRDTWYYAYILDINEEERNKGKTQEVGRATFELPTVRFTILDAPGHKGLVPDMVSGAAQADIGVLIISARKGEFETGFERGGQTREHALLAKTLGVNKLIVAVNKMDDPTCNWDKQRYDDICKKVAPFFKSCGFNVQRDVTYIPIAGLMGANLKEHVAKPGSPCYCKDGAWYDGPTLLEILEKSPLPPRDEKGPLRVPLLNGYRDGGVMTVGKIESGVAVVDQDYMLMPNKIKIKLQGVRVNEVDVTHANPGENVELKVLGVEEDQIHKGSVICSIADLCPNVNKFRAQVIVIELLEHKPLIAIGYSCVLHVHTACEEVVFDVIHSTIEQASKKKKVSPPFARPGQIVECTLKLQSPICLETYAVRPQLGRFSLRDEGKTIAIGKVLSIIE